MPDVLYDHDTHLWSPTTFRKSSYVKGRVYQRVDRNLALWESRAIGETHQASQADGSPVDRSARWPENQE